MSIIEDIIKREGGAQVTNDPLDRGGLTQYGLTKRDNPEVWADGVVTHDEAVSTYERKYFHGPGFSKIPTTHRRTQSQLVDYGVNSGPGVAIQKLQGILGVTVDGELGPQTLDALLQRNDLEVNNKLVAERVKMIAKLVQKSPSQIRFLVGWINRALEFVS